MVRTILDALPSWLILCLVVPGAMAFAVGGLRRFHRRFPNLSVKGEARLGLDSLHAVCAFLFALSLSLVVVNGYSSMKATDGIVRSEATNLAQLYRDSRGLSGIAGQLEVDIARYDRGVVDDEWSAMRTGGQSAEVDAALDSMFDAMLSYRPVNDAEQVAYREAFRVLNDLVQARRDRLSAAGARVPAPLEVYLMLGAVLVIALSWLFCSPGDRRHEVMVAGLAGIIAFSVVLALVLAYPFSGDIRVGPDAFRLGSLAKFW